MPFCRYLLFYHRKLHCYCLLYLLNGMIACISSSYPVSYWLYHNWILLWIHFVSIYPLIWMKHYILHAVVLCNIAVQDPWKSIPRNKGEKRWWFVQIRQILAIRISRLHIQYIPHQSHRQHRLILLLIRISSWCEIDYILSVYSHVVIWEEFVCYIILIIFM